MGFDVPQNLGLAGFDPVLVSSLDAPAGGEGADLATFAPLGADSIQSSPLAFFGDMVQQIGKAMAQDGMSSSANGDAPGSGMSDAMGMLENVVALMSAYGLGDGASGAAPAPASTSLADTRTRSTGGVD
jgi:hypothetical protein